MIIYQYSDDCGTYWQILTKPFVEVDKNLEERDHCTCIHQLFVSRNSVNVAGWIQFQSEVLSHREHNQFMLSLLLCDEIITSKCHHYNPRIQICEIG